MPRQAAHQRYKPFLLTAAIVAADQATKAWVVATIPQGSVRFSWFGDFLWICHVRNSAIGFSLGDNLPDTAKRLLFILVPLAFMILLVVYVVRSDGLSCFQRWLLAGIVGGGMGNIIDRIFREEWVVDFISVKVYGLFGFERWPTFNIADASVVVTGILLLLSLFFPGSREQASDGEHRKGVSHE